MNDLANNLVINISKYKLSEIELRTLQKGTSYVPTTRTNGLKLEISFFKLMRKLRLF